MANTTDMKNFPINEKTIRMAGGSIIFNKWNSNVILVNFNHLNNGWPPGTNPVTRLATPLANKPKPRVGLLPNLSFTKMPHT